MSRRVKSVRKNHGPCETCGKPIVIGQPMIVSRGKAKPGDEKVWNNLSEFKRHGWCKFPDHRKGG